MSAEKAIFITEDYLKTHFGLHQQGEIQLALGTRFTPAAEQMLKERNITVKWYDENGQVFVKPDGKAKIEQVHPLKSNNLRPKNACALCHTEVSKKTSLMTHLDNQTLVAKTHPRIALRAKLDLCISYCVLVQSGMESQPEVLQSFIADIRSYLGQILKSEVTREPLPELYIAEFDSTSIHQWSHNPLKYLGHDHLLPDVRYGKLVAKLNYLRAQIRELELSAIATFLTAEMQIKDGEVCREDLIAGLNRLSSAVYVLAILVWRHQSGHNVVLGSISR